jgi:restriction system protein
MAIRRNGVLSQITVRPHTGLFFSAGGFTADAQREARSQEKRRLILVDSTRLVELWSEHYMSLDDEARRRLPLRLIYLLAPGD